MSHEMTDRTGLYIWSDISGFDGQKQTVAVRFGSKAVRTFNAEKWTELDAAVRKMLGIEK